MAEKKSSIEEIIEACSEVLGEDAIEGLKEAELDDEDFFMAICGELMSAGVEDPEQFLVERDIY